MIKLEKQEPPPELTAEFQREGTERYIAFRKQVEARKADSPNGPAPQEPIVWKPKFIEETLPKSSNGKCAFCETKLKTESKYAEIEHFLPKSLYPEQVLEWANLMPCCSRCNRTKNDLDTVATPIVNPFVDTPKKHLAMKYYRLVGRDQKGKDTINSLGLNDFDHLQRPRFELAGTASTQLEDIWNLCGDYIQGNTKNRNRINQIIARTKEILRMTQNDNAYAATIATSICEDEHFAEIMKTLRKNNEWDDELETLYNIAQSNSLLFVEQADNRIKTTEHSMASTDDENNRSYDDVNG